jgi:hypothetical protein
MGAWPLPKYRLAAYATMGRIAATVNTGWKPMLPCAQKSARLNGLPRP